MNFRRDWEGTEWEIFSRKLVQYRHKAHNVQNVPDKVKGDAGVEFFTLDGCAYQSYAPEEVSDVAKASSAMKSKITRDLPKLIKRADDIVEFLGPVKIERWILLTPFLDDKSVVSHAHSKADEIRKAGLPFVASDFKTLVHSQEDFQIEYEKLRLESLGAPLKVAVPTDGSIEKVDNEIDEVLNGKLKRAFPSDTDVKTLERRRSHIVSFLQSENVLDSLKVEHPLLWEKAMRTLQSEENRLSLIGSSSTIPSKMLNDSADRLEDQLRSDLPNLENDPIAKIVMGKISDWLIRCPLDFEETT